MAKRLGHAPGSAIANPTERFKSALREKHLRATPGRLIILEALSRAQSPCSAQELFDRVSALSKSASARPDRVTVYRTLNSLVDAGLAHRIDPGDRTFRFSLTDHARCSHDHHDHEHPHFVCDACGQVECLPDAEVVLRSKHHRSTPAQAMPPRRFRDQAVVLHGTCGPCVQTTGAPTPPRGTSPGANAGRS